jgi:hypothetical protein
MTSARTVPACLVSLLRTLVKVAMELLPKVRSRLLLVLRAHYALLWVPDFLRRFWLGECFEDHAWLLQIEAFEVDEDVFGM